MSIAVQLSGIALSVYQGNPSEMLKDLIIGTIRSLELSSYQDKRVLLKGCGEKGIDAYAYLEITMRLMNVVKTIMYGEACSAVPVFKRKVNL